MEWVEVEEWRSGGSYPTPNYEDPSCSGTYSEQITFVVLACFRQNGDKGGQPVKLPEECVDPK